MTRKETITLHPTFLRQHLAEIMFNNDAEMEEESKSKMRIKKGVVLDRFCSRIFLLCHLSSLGGRLVHALSLLPCGILSALFPFHR